MNELIDEIEILSPWRMRMEGYETILGHFLPLSPHHPHPILLHIPYGGSYENERRRRMWGGTCYSFVESKRNQFSITIHGIIIIIIN